MNLTIDEIRTRLAEKVNGLILPDHDASGHFYKHKDKGVRFASVTAKSGILDNPRLKKWAARLAVEHIDKNWNVITPENKEAIFKQAVLVHEDVFEDSGDVGTEGHGVVETYLRSWMHTGIKPKDIKQFLHHDDVRPWAISRSAEMFINDFELLPIACELKVMSLRHKFAGTLDFLAMIPRITEKPQRPCEHEWWNLKTNEDYCIKCNGRRVWEFVLVDWKTSNSIDKVEYAMQTSAYWTALNEMTRLHPRIVTSGLQPKHILIVRLDKEKAKYDVMKVTQRVKTFKAFLHCSKVEEWLNDGEEKLAPLRPRTKITYTISNGTDTGASQLAHGVRESESVQ